MKQVFLFGLLLIATILCCKDTTAQHSGKLPFNGGTLFYESTGQGSPLIFVHAGFQDHRMWADQVKHFSKRYRVIVFDVPGHGQTTGSGERPLAGDVILALMKGLHLERAALVGLSLGGAVALDFAVQHPNRVSKLVLAGSGLPGWEENREVDTTTKQYFTDLMAALNRGDSAGAATVFVQSWFAGPARNRATLPPTLWETGYTTTLQNMQRHKVSGWPRFATPAAIHRLSTLTMPVLILTGALDMPEVLQMNAWLKTQIPGARQVVLPDVAHMINLEQPARFNELVDAFLAK